MIISASRRTDIPAFYTPWFMNRVREGFLLTRNPFNPHQLKRVSLLPDEVDAIVFWTRNPSMLMPHLQELDRLGYRYYFQYTLTGYPRNLEATVPRPRKAIQTFSELSDRIGPDRVVWRYDPILLSNMVDSNEHKRLFSKIASLLAGRTRRVVISFFDPYKKTQRNLSRIDGLVYSDITQDRGAMSDLARFMFGEANSHGMSIESCAELSDLQSAGIPPGKCIDAGLINTLFGLSVDEAKDPGQRKECGCVKSVDIGAYNTCLHGCAYCYATFSQGTVRSNRKKHDPHSPLLLGGVEGIDKRLLAPVIHQGSLF